MLAERFKRAGFATAAFIASPVLDRQSGLARGFDLYSDRFEPGDGPQARRRRRRRGCRVDDSACLAEAARRTDSSAGCTSTIRTRRTCRPDATPRSIADRPYDGTVAWSDEVVGRLVAALRDAGALDSTLVIVTSDHGEALGEHGEDVHGYFVYEATLRVPLVFRGPGVKPGTRLDGAGADDRSLPDHPRA